MGSIPTLLFTNGDKGTWGVRNAYGSALRVHANLMKRGIQSPQSAGLFRPYVPLSPAVLRLQKPTLETFANLAKAYPYRTEHISDNMARVFQPSGWRKHEL
jgi:hypothetical protein